MSVHDNEILARFIVNEGWVNRLENRIKGDAFRPRKDHRAPKTSVTRHDGSDLNEIKRRGEAFIHIPRRDQITLYGWADVKAESVRVASQIPRLDIEEDLSNKRDPYHANIVGWNLDEGKAMIQAEDVAKKATLFLLS